MYLSSYIAIATGISMTSKIMQKEGRSGDSGMTYKDIAILRTKWWQKMQGALGFVSAMTAMYLFSVLGAEGMPNHTIFWIGTIGTTTLGVASVIELYTLTRDLPAQHPQATASCPETNGESRPSLRTVGDDMFMAGLV